jgi:hypothetical protein
MNIVRGVLAEFLVKLAVKDTSEIRAACSNHDIVMPPDVTIEVKASAYLQSWPQPALSNIGFSGLRGRPWLEDGSFGLERVLRSDVYVFAIHTCRIPDHYDPLDVSQWEFRVLARAQLEEHGGRSIQLTLLDRIAPHRFAWKDLREAVQAAAEA